MEEIHRHGALIRQSGATADLLDLPARGIHGNSHSPMMDTNSDQVADLLLERLAARRADGAFD